MVKQDELIFDMDSKVESGELLVNVTVESPYEQSIEKRNKVAVICVIDVSGSMNTSAT